MHTHPPYAPFLPRLSREARATLPRTCVLQRVRRGTWSNLQQLRCSRSLGCMLPRCSGVTTRLAHERQRCRYLPRREASLPRRYLSSVTRYSHCQSLSNVRGIQRQSSTCFMWERARRDRTLGTGCIPKQQAIHLWQDGLQLIRETTGGEIVGKDNITNINISPPELL